MVVEMGMSDFKVKVKFTETAQVIKWCKEHFGGDGLPNYHLKTDIVKDLRWWCRQEHIFFRDEKDYIWFRLKWA